MKDQFNQYNTDNLVALDDLGLSEAELFTPVAHDDLESEKITAPRYSYWSSVFRVFFKKKINIFMLSLLALIIIFSYVYPLFSGYDRFANILNGASKHLSPSLALERMGQNIHWILGSGGSGESTFDAVWNGAEKEIQTLTDRYVKKIDMFMMEVYNIVGNVPSILLIAVLVLIMSPTFWTLVFAMTVTGWLFIAYFIRTQVIIIRDREYNLASRCLGTPITRIAVKNILPFMTSVIVTLLAIEIPTYISYEVFLSYIGMGMSDMSLGKMIYAAEPAMLTPGWEFEFWSPVTVASIITIVLYVVGQNLGDASDPRTHV